MGPLAGIGERSRLPLRRKWSGNLLRHLRSAKQPRHGLRWRLPRHSSLRRLLHRHLVEHEGARLHGTATELLILADAGGSNNCRSWAWKTELQNQLCNPFGITITVAHYPTGASKWNPIEHRLFSQISKNWAGEPLVSHEKMLGFIRSTSTKTGLTVSAHLDRAEYPTGRKPDRQLITSLALKPDKILPQWNYTIAHNL